MKRLRSFAPFFAFLCFAGAAWGQSCPVGYTATNGICVANSSGGGTSVIACASTPGPGNTTGTYRQQCQDGNGAIFACNNSGGCTTSGDWVAVGGSGSGTVTVVGAGNLTSGALMTGGGSQTAQTACTGCTLTSGGLMTLPGSSSGSATIGASATGSLLNLNGTNATVSAAGAITANGGITAGPDGTHAGAASLYGNTALPTVASNLFSLFGPSTATFTSYGWQVPSTAPGTNTVPLFGAASGGASPITYVSNATTVNGASCALAGTCNANYTTGSFTDGHAIAANGTGGQIKDGGAFNASLVGLGSVTNDAQTKAAIVPNTAPTAGQILVGNAGGTAYAPVTMSGCTITSAGVFTCSGGGGSVTVVGAGNLTSGALMTGGGSQTAQTACTGCTLAKRRSNDVPGSSSGSATIGVSATGSLLNLNGTNATVSTAGAIIATSETVSGSSVTDSRLPLL